MKTEHMACLSEEDVTGWPRAGAATALSLQGIPPSFCASSQAPASDVGWIMWQIVC